MLFQGKPLILFFQKNPTLKTSGGLIKLSVIKKKVITIIMALCSDRGVYKAVPNKCIHG
jgi:hypothetical protein